MGNTLAIYTPGIGVPSETFIRRHLLKLLPGRTVGICDVVLSPPKGNWGVECDVFETSSRFNWTFHLLRQHFSKGRAIPMYDPLMRFLERSKVDTVLGEFLDQSLPLFRLLRRSGYRFFVHAHGFDVTRSLTDEKMRQAYLEYVDADGVITMSEISRRILINSGLPENKVHTAHYGIEIPEIQPPEVSDAKPIRCLAVGRMTNKKSPICLLESFRLAHAVNSNLKLDYVGTGELFVMAQQFVKIASLDSAVTFHGVQPSEFVHKILQQSDIFIQHSMVDPFNGDMEGFPLAILEAMAHGLPVVSTRHAGITEQVVEGETGYLVKEGDVQGMAEKIGLLASNRFLRSRMSSTGYHRLRENFSWEINRNRLLNVMGIA